MAGNSLGHEFVVTIFGESHGKCVGAVVDGCPAGIDLRETDVQTELDRRIPKTSGLSSSRIEEDKVEILSGTFGDKTTGAPIAMVVWNRDVDSRPYERLKDIPRPGHADYPARMKYSGLNDYRGGGRFSGRMTVALVMAGALATKVLAKCGVEVLAYTLSIGSCKSEEASAKKALHEVVYSNPVRCADPKAASLMEREIAKAAASGDSLGGVVKAVAHGVPVGVGEPFFSAIDAEIARALFCIPAVKGVEFGAGFGAALLKGSENNDPIVVKNGKVGFEGNRSGGVLGGLSTGQDITVQVAFKPTPSIRCKQRSVNLKSMEMVDLEIVGRHDPCVVPKAVPVVQSVFSIVLVDLMIRSGAIAKVLR